jgi:DNA-binding winged helix-turn-helix (wHTH) protein
MNQERTQYRIVEKTKDSSHKYHEIAKFPITLGRSEQCDLVFYSNLVSGRQAEITLDNGVVKIRDGDGTKPSQNGTFVTKKQIYREWEELRHNDYIYFGKPNMEGTIELIFQFAPKTIPQTPGTGLVAHSSVHVDQQSRTIKLNGEIVEGIAGREFEILHLLWENTGRYVSNAMISQVGWPENVEQMRASGFPLENNYVFTSPDNIRQRINSIRKVIGANLIENSRNHGYRLISSQIYN